CSVATLLCALRRPVMAASDPKLFVGPVLETHLREGWIMMRGGASKKYARVKILCDQKTAWTGFEVKDKQVKAGDPIRVTVVPAKGGEFRAVTLYKYDPHQRPVLGSPSPAP